jgi:hypothetical protein
MSDQENISNTDNKVGVTNQKINDTEQVPKKITFPVTLEVRVLTEDGTHKTQQLASQVGQSYTLSESNAEIILEASGNASDDSTIEIHNKLTTGAIDASVYKDGKLLLKENVNAQKQKVSFVLRPKMFW